MKLRPIITIIQALPLVYIVAALLFGGSQALASDFVIPAYVIIVVFTFPSLVSRFIWKKHYIGTAAALTFLYYPVLYLLSLVGGLLIGSAGNWMSVFAILTIVAWNALVAYATWKLPEPELLQVSEAVGLITIVSVAFSVFMVVTLRPTDSILALDYLQHNTVILAMQAGKLCILPGACSNLFLQQGYTTIYHATLSTITSLVGSNFPHLIFELDMVFAGVMSGLTYRLMRKASVTRFWAAVGTVLALLVFVNGAYEFGFFIPQTLALMMFLHLLTAKHTMQSLVVGIILLALTHFIIGSFLAVILLIKVIVIDDYLAKERLHLPNWPLMIFLVMAPVFSLAINLAGFSIEKTLQASDVQTIGALTNLYSPDNMLFVAGIFGFASIVLVIALVYFIFHKRKSSWVWLALITISINLTVYFLAPTYANKFMLGFGIFGSMLIVLWLQSIKWSQVFKYTIAGLLIITFAANYFLQYKQYERFYLQDTGIANAIVPQDQAAIDYLKTYPDNCLVISDPYTQVIVAGITGRETASAQYMIPPSRKAIENFNEQPNAENYAALLKIKEIAGKTDLCYLYTSRMEESVKGGYRYWVDNIYSYIVDNDYPILTLPPAVSYITAHGGTLVFRNPNFYLLKLADPPTMALDNV